MDPDPCPEQHRLIYVHTATTPQETAARLTAVRQYAENCPEPSAAGARHVDFGRRLASRSIDTIGRKYMAIPRHAPAPRLGQAVATGSSGTACRRRPPGRLELRF